MGSCLGAGRAEQDEGVVRETIQKQPGERLGLVLDGAVICDVVAKSPAWRAGMQQYVGWRVDSVAAVPVASQEQLDSAPFQRAKVLTVSLRSGGAASTPNPAADDGFGNPTQRVDIRVTGQRPGLPSNTSDIGLQTTTGRAGDGTVKIVKAVSLAAQAGLDRFEGWRIVAVNGTGVVSFDTYERAFAAAVQRFNSRIDLVFTLETAHLQPSEIALYKIRRAAAAFLARRKIDDLIFELILRTIEIQEEADLNHSLLGDGVLDDDDDSSDNEATAKKSNGKSKKKRVRRPSTFGADKYPRLSPERVQAMLVDLTQRGARPKEAAEVLSLINMARAVMRSRDTVQVIDLPNPTEDDERRGILSTLTVIGDLHGQLSDLLYLLSLGYPSAAHVLLFNGDFVDRGNNSVEVLIILMILVVQYPAFVFLNRGNHEDEKVNAKYGFDDECSRDKYSPEVFREVQEFFMELPLVHVARGLAIVHGGLPECEELTLDEINRVDRFRPVPKGGPKATREDRIFRGLLWSDPKEAMSARWEPSPRGAGVLFSKRVTDDFLTRNRLLLLVRSHQTVHDGVKSHHGGLVRTVFSASEYRGKERNQGAALRAVWQRRPPGDRAGQPHPWGIPTLSAVQWNAEAKLKVVGSWCDVAEPLVAPRVEVLKRVQSMIFTRQIELLLAFQEVDVDGTGTVSQEQWIAVMATVIESLPWCFLCSKVTKKEADGTIAYAPFLERYQSKLARRWIRAWVEAILPHVILRLGTCISDVEEQFVAAASKGTRAKTLSYHEFYMFLTRRGHLHALDPRAVYYILQELDENGDGMLTLSEFRRAYETRYRAVKNTEHDNNLIQLWDLKVARPEVYKAFLDAFKGAERATSPGGKGLTVPEFADMAVRSLGGDTPTWVRTGLVIAVQSGKNVVRLKQLVRLVKRLASLHEQASFIAAILQRLSATKVTLRSLYNSMDNGTGQIFQEQFVRGMKRFGVSASDTLDTLWLLVDVNQDGFVTFNEFKEALEVTDVGSIDEERYVPPMMTACKLLSFPGLKADTDSDRPSKSKSSKKAKKSKHKKKNKKSRRKERRKSSSSSGLTRTSDD
ncbi:Serine/threonine-protein phosphatase T [Diplonema papillatum]|nr:Serine/threonine-protein phosphatase T [Diplonema papillatum]